MQLTCSIALEPPTYFSKTVASIGQERRFVQHKRIASNTNPSRIYDLDKDQVVVRVCDMFQSMGREKVGD
jgi:hypothetical protein